MKIEITGKSMSKKGTVWLQAKLIKPEGQEVYHAPGEGEVYECVKVDKEFKNEQLGTYTKIPDDEVGDLRDCW